MLTCSIVFQGLNNLSFENNLWASFTSLDLRNNNVQSKCQCKAVHMSLQQASRSKVSVKPLELKNAKEPLLNLHKPKEPYTATIVSVEGLVGAKAPG